VGIEADCLGALQLDQLGSYCSSSLTIITMPNSSAMQLLTAVATTSQQAMTP